MTFIRAAARPVDEAPEDVTVFVLKSQRAREGIMTPYSEEHCQRNKTEEVLLGREEQSEMFSAKSQKTNVKDARKMIKKICLSSVKVNLHFTKRGNLQSGECLQMYTVLCRSQCLSVLSSPYIYTVSHKSEHTPLKNVHVVGGSACQCLGCTPHTASN